MALKDLEPFNRLSLVTTEMDEIEVAHLLRIDEDLRLVCQDCGSKKFKVEVLIEAEMSLIAGRHTVITHVDYKRAIVNRVVRCDYCDCTDFITITEPSQEKSNGQSQSGIE